MLLKWEPMVASVSIIFFFCLSLIDATRVTQISKLEEIVDNDDFEA
jgi:hypothetical protein